MPSEDFKKKLLAYCMNLVSNELSADIPRNYIQESLAYGIEAKFGLDMLSSLQIAENFMTKMPKIMKMCEEHAEKLKGNKEEAFNKHKGA